MKKIVIFAMTALVAVSCASKKQASSTANAPVNKGDVEVFIPCSGSEFLSDKTTFRASGEGYSNSMTTAKDKALQVARARLATSIELTMKRVIDSYASSYESGVNEESKSKYQEISRTIVNRQLQGCVPICEKIMKTAEGAFRAYVAVELGGPEIIEAVSNSVKSDDKLRIDYEYEKFKEVFNAEMDKLASEKK